jgi:hypothetical protein
VIINRSGIHNPELSGKPRDEMAIASDSQDDCFKLIQGLLELGAAGISKWLSDSSCSRQLHYFEVSRAGITSDCWSYMICSQSLFD